MSYTHDDIEAQKADQNPYCTCVEPQPYPFSEHEKFCAWCGGFIKEPEKDGNE